MALFGIGKIKSFLGIDIGAAGVKLVEFQELRDRTKLHTYAYTERQPSEIGGAFLDDPVAASAVIKEMTRRAKTTTVKAVTGLPISSIFSSVISVPKMAEKEQRGAIEVQARKLISMPLEEMILDTKIITPPAELAQKGPDALKNIQVLLTAAPKTLVNKYLEIFKQSGLELVSLETEALALIRALVGKDKSTLMLIDMGALRTSVLVVVGGIPFLSRSIDVGGLKLTKAASDALGVPLDQAESMKTDFRSFGTLAPGSIPPVFETLVEQVVNEINFSLKLFSGLENLPTREGGAAASKTVEKVILTGGGSLLPNLDVYLSSKLNLRVFRGVPLGADPVSRRCPAAPDEIGPRFSVAIGLAMREFEA